MAVSVHGLNRARLAESPPNPPSPKFAPLSFGVWTAQNPRRPHNCHPRFSRPPMSLLSRHLRFPASASSPLSLLSHRVRALATALPPDAPVSVTVTPDGIAVVRFDAPGEKVNTLSEKLMKSFDAVLETLESDPKVRAGVLISGKPDSFIAGADISMLVRPRARPHARLCPVAWRHTVMRLGVHGLRGAVASCVSCAGCGACCCGPPNRRHPLTHASPRAPPPVTGRPPLPACYPLQSACTSAEQLTALSWEGQKVMDRLAACKRPIVAAINGACLGGGVEVALAWYGPMSVCAGLG